MSNEVLSHTMTSETYTGSSYGLELSSIFVPALVLFLSTSSMAQEIPTDGSNNGNTGKTLEITGASPTWMPADDEIAAEEDLEEARIEAARTLGAVMHTMASSADEAIKLDSSIPQKTRWNLYET